MGDESLGHKGKFGGRRMHVAAISSFFCRLVKFGRNKKRRPRNVRVIHAELVKRGEILKIDTMTFRR
jgi:hypothetical protein